jgi:Domain of unknown function (DUF5594)
MNQEIAKRFEAEFAPRIAGTIAGLYGSRIKASVIPNGGAGQPTRIHLQGKTIEPLRRFAHSLNAYLTWDAYEIEKLLGAGGEIRFTRYLRALPDKIAAWQAPRQIDFVSRSQAEILVLIGGLDFES